MLFKKDICRYPIAIGKDNNFERVVISSRGWPCKYRMDNIAVDKEVSNSRICRQ